MSSLSRWTFGLAVVSASLAFEPSVRSAHAGVRDTLRDGRASATLLLPATRAGIDTAAPAFHAATPGGIARKGVSEQSIRADRDASSIGMPRREQPLAVRPSDPRFDQQWWLFAHGAVQHGVAGFETAWLRNRGLPVSGPAPVVAVLDSGITSHPELNARLLPGYDFVSDTEYANDGDGRDADPSDPGNWLSAAEQAARPDKYGGCPPVPRSTWHGTAIAGQIAAVTDNGVGVAAATWQGVSVLPVRVAGRCGAAVADVVAGMRWAGGLPVDGAPPNPYPARVVVLGYGAAASCDANDPDPAARDAARSYRQALRELRAAGVFVVVGAGNGRGAVQRPANCPGAFAVTATHRDGYKANYANLGLEVALATPGGDVDNGATCDRELADSGIVTTSDLGATSPAAAGYAAAAGTSFAAPAVAATAALMLAVNPALTVDQLADGLRRSARPHVGVPPLGACAADNKGRCGCTTTTCGAGLLDADEALRYAAAPSAYVAPPRSTVVLDSEPLQRCAALLGRPPVGPVDPGITPPPGDPDAGSGGGATGPLWIVALALATVALRRHRPAAPCNRER